MGNTIRVRVRGGVLEPIEKLDLPDGTEVTITILATPAQRDTDAFRRSFGSWKGTIDAEDLIRKIRESREVSTRPEPRL
jgi:predicted DNA-binding antitoxin AbrB/MazE fold protein